MNVDALLNCHIPKWPLLPGKSCNLLGSVYYRHQFHVSSNSDLSGDSGPSDFLVCYLPGGRPFGPKQQDLCGILSTSRPDPGKDSCCSSKAAFSG